MPNPHLRISTITNQNQGGGNSKAGLAPTVGLSSFAKRFTRQRGVTVDRVVRAQENKRWVQIGQDIDGESADDDSGISVSMNAAGDRVAIGATRNDGVNGADSGHVRVYKYNGTTWVQIGQDIDGEAVGDLSGNSVSMNAAGDRVAIGATRNDGVNGENSGHVRVYQYNGTTWRQIGEDIDGESADDDSGFSVSMNAVGDRVAIGANLNNGVNGAFSGHVRVYKYNGTTWRKLGQDINGEAAGDFTVIRVSMNAAGDRVAIGATGNDGNGENSGHVRVYQYDGTTWRQIGQDIDGEAAGDLSGSSVSMNAAGDRVAIGATGNDGNGVDSGHVRVYKYNGTTWVQIGQDIDGESDGNLDGDLSGSSVSMNAAGDRVAIGATRNYGVNGADSGNVRVYKYNGTTWVQIGQDIDGEADGDFSGNSVSMNATGDRVAIGAPFNNGVNGDISGHVRVYEYR